MANRYRYILCGLVNPQDPISRFRLLASSQLYKREGRTTEAIRVKIPEDMELTKDNGYSITDDERTLEELGYDCRIFYEGRWITRNDLKGIIPAEWFEYLDKHDNIKITAEGYMAHDHYKQYVANKWKEATEGINQVCANYIFPYNRKEA